MVPYSLKEYVSLREDKKLLIDSLYYHKMNPKDIEIKDFLSFSNIVVNKLDSDEDIDNWYLGTDLRVIPDFDVLWFGKKIIVNLDLKHKMKKDLHTRILKKFKEQSQITKLINDYEVKNFVFVSSEKKLYFYSDGKLKNVTFDSLLKLLKEYASNHQIDNFIDSLKPSDYLISPLNNPDKFIDGKYWLTPHQKDIVTECENKACGLYAISGPAGTGKSLIAYDLSKRLKKYKKILFIVSGSLRDSHKLLENKLQPVKFIPANQLEKTKLDDYDCVFVDEAQRLYQTERKKLATWAESNKDNHLIVILYDPKQALSGKDAGGIINSLANSWEKRNIGKKYTLNKGIRSNPSIEAFVTQLFNLSKKPSSDIGIDDILDSVEIKYFSKPVESFGWIKNKIANHYQFIVPTPSQYDKSSSDEFKKMNREYLNSHNAIGEEFDKVVTYLDDYIFYNNDIGTLRGKREEYYLIEKETYVNMSRAKSKLALAVIGNKDVYQAIMEVILKFKDKN